MGKFRYSLEYLFTKLAKSRKPGKNIDPQDVLDVASVLQNPEPLIFVQPVNEQEIPFTVLGQGD